MPTSEPPRACTRTRSATGAATGSSKLRRQGGELRVGEPDVVGAHVLLEVLDGRRARDRQHHAGAAEQARERDLCARRADLVRDVVERRAGGTPGRRPRDERDARLLARLQDAVGAAVVEVVAVLDGDDVDGGARPLELLTAHVRDADVADLALALQVAERAERLLDRHVRVDGVQLVEIDPLQAEPPQAALAALAQPLGAAVAVPAPRSGTHEAALRRDHEAVRIRMERLRDQLLADVGAVGVGGVDQRDAALDDAAQKRPGGGRVGRRPPHAVSRDAHGAEAEPAHLEVAAEPEGRLHRRSLIGSIADSMDVQELTPTLWRWSTRHPDWTEEEGGDDGWDPDVWSVYLEAPDAIVLIDPLVPEEPDERERFLHHLDADVERLARPVRVLITVYWHERSSRGLADRYGGEIWAYREALPHLEARVERPFELGDALPGGVQGIDAGRRDEVLYWLPRERALVAGDVLLGTDGGVRVCPAAWLPEGVT